MNNLKRIIGFFASLRTAIWLTITLICLLLYGSVIMPSYEEFSMLHTIALFDWMNKTPVSITWWLWAAMAVLSLLTANTIVCSIESVLRKKEARQWILVVSPQIMHMGFLFILLAHLLSSYGSAKGITYAYDGTVLQLSDDLQVRFNKVNVSMDASGYIKDWAVDIEYFNVNRVLGTDRILPNSPSFRDGIGIYIKTIQSAPFPVAIIEISREPGAVWALVGGVFFMIGMISLLSLKIMREENVY